MENIEIEVSVYLSLQNIVTKDYDFDKLIEEAIYDNNTWHDIEDKLEDATDWDLYDIKDCVFDDFVPKYVTWDKDDMYFNYEECQDEDLVAVTVLIKIDTEKFVEDCK